MYEHTTNFIVLKVTKFVVVSRKKRMSQADISIRSLLVKDFAIFLDIHIDAKVWHEEKKDLDIHHQKHSTL